MSETPRSDAKLTLRGRREDPDKVRHHSERVEEDRKLPTGPSQGRRPWDRNRDREWERDKQRDRNGRFDSGSSSSSRYFNNRPNSHQPSQKPSDSHELPKGPAALRNDSQIKRVADEPLLPTGPKKVAKKEDSKSLKHYSDGRSYRPGGGPLIEKNDDRGRDAQYSTGRQFPNRDRRDGYPTDSRIGYTQAQGQFHHQKQYHIQNSIQSPGHNQYQYQTQNNYQQQGFKPGFKRTRLSFLRVSRDSTVYERVVQVGEGTYGKVYKARNIITGAFVALKRLRMEAEKEGFPITAMREMRLLQSLENKNIVSLMEIMVENKQIYMVFDYADNDLTGLLANPELKLSHANCKDIFKQLLEGISYLHSRRIIHRDIKGSNMLVDGHGVVKIADFGLARKMKSQNSRDYTNRVITLWYRPPELLLGTTDYGREVDMWGLGCLLVELFTKQALFQAQDEISQLHVIFEIMGTPTVEQWSSITELPWYEMVKPNKFYEPQLQKKLSGVLSKECLELAAKLLSYNPRQRMTAKVALRHAYFSEDPKPERLKPEVLSGEWHEFEAKKKRRKEREERRQQDELRKRREESRSVETTSSTEIQRKEFSPISKVEVECESNRADLDNLTGNNQSQADLKSPGSDKDEITDSAKTVGLEAEERRLEGGND